MVKIFEGSYLKIKRADHHIADLERIFSTYVQAYRYNFIQEPNFDESTIVKILLDKQLPLEFSLCLGDVVHNLRVALDHAMWELIGLDGGTQDRHTSLPTGSNIRDYEATCRGIKTPRADTKQFFIDLGIYKSGPGEILYRLHLLDNFEKHTLIIPTLSATRIRDVEVLNPDGTVAFAFGDCSVDMGQNGISEMTVGGSLTGLIVNFGPNPDLTLQVFFKDIQFFEFKQISPTILHLRDVVFDCISQFEFFVKNRT